MTDAPAAAVDCLLLQTGDDTWLVPASLVVEVIAHTTAPAPERLAWRGHELTCVTVGPGRQRAIVVLRGLHEPGARFYALAVRDTPRPLAVRAPMLSGPATQPFDLDGQLVRLFDPAAWETRLPAPG